jgi:hypothetical protein
VNCPWRRPLRAAYRRTTSACTVTVLTHDDVVLPAGRLLDRLREQQASVLSISINDQPAVVAS